ncbi:type IV secretion system protein VirB7 [Bartonella sp. B41]
MKLKITVVAIIAIVFTGCSSLRGTKKPPRCDGRNTRVLNKDKWNWNGRDVISREKNVKSVVAAPIILNMLESEKANPDVISNPALLNSVNREVSPMEAAREK